METASDKKTSLNFLPRHIDICLRVFSCLFVFGSSIAHYDRVIGGADENIFFLYRLGGGRGRAGGNPQHMVMISHDFLCMYMNLCLMNWRYV